MIITQAPLKYVQGFGIINDVGELVKKNGKNFLVLSSKTPLRLYKEIMEKSFAKAGVKAGFELFGGEITLAERDRVAAIIKSSPDKIDAVIGLGGGKTLDAAKSVANQVDLPTICIPTIASNDAPCSALSVMYSEEGHVVDVEFYAANPSLVICDSEIIMNSPARMLMSGVGDALATYYEARVCFEHGFGNCF
jgi:glycerol dehydrogenase